MSFKGNLYSTPDKIFWQCVLSVCVRTVVERYFSIFHCQSFSLSASPLPLKTFPLSFLSSSSYSLSCPFCPFPSSCCLIWVPDLSSLISVRPLLFDVRPHTATLTTTKTKPPLILLSLFVSHFSFSFYDYSSSIYEFLFSWACCLRKGILKGISLNLA